MKTKVLILAAVITVALFMSGCVVLSFYPLYTEDTVILDDRIIGNWESFGDGSFGNDTVVWEISFPKEIKKMKKNHPFDTNNILNKNTYELTTYQKSSPEDSAVFHLHLVKIGNNHYVDFFPVEWEKENILLMTHLMHAHTFAKIEFGKNVRIKWINPDRLEELIEKNQIRIRHEDNGIYKLITAKPEELQKFMKKYGNDDRTYEDGLNYELIKEFHSKTINILSP